MMDPQRILYVYFSDYSTGAHRAQILHTTNKLTELGIEVTIVAAGDLHQFAEENDLSVESTVRLSPTVRSSETLSRILYYLTAIRMARTVDVVFTRDISFLKALSVVPARLVPPILYEAHQCYSAIGALSEVEELTRLQRASTIITQADGTAQALEVLGAEVHAVIPNAANADLLPDEYPSDLAARYSITPDTTTVVYAGSLDSWKNDIELVIRTFNSLNWENKRLLILGGPSSRVEELQSYIETTGLELESIFFVGEVSQREVFRYLTLADIGVVPLKSGNRRSAEFTSPIKLFEYDLAELKIVAADVPAIQSLELESVHLYQPGDQQTMLDAFEAARANGGDGSSVSYTYSERASRLKAALKATYR